MRRIRVRSTTIRTVGYDTITSCLEIVFVKGPAYRYFGVPQSVFAELLEAESHGRYLNERIKGLYAYEEVP
jgi:hypothetical protein